MDNQKYYFIEIVSNILNIEINELNIEEIQGDASDRRYYRLLPITSTGTAESVVLMKLAAPFSGELPFINIQKFLSDNRVPVPAVYHYDEEKGFLFLEDCGNTTFEALLKEGCAAERVELYKKALDVLSQIHFSSRINTSHCIAFSLAFDLPKLMFELKFMEEHLIKGLYEKKISPTHVKVIDDFFLSLCEELASQERVFTHRDYHSRNIMVLKNQLKVIDFQDARLGPIQYDLVSLLRDSYVSLTNREVEILSDYYINKIENLKGVKIERESFFRIFDLMSIQRNLKAMGTFAFQKVVKKNERYLQYIEPTKKMVLERLGKHEEFATFKEVLSCYINV